MKTVQTKREREKRMVTEMIKLYCKKQHHTKGGELCSECDELNEYAKLRSDKCPFMETKTFCSNCKVHCYKPVMREKNSCGYAFFQDPECYCIIRYGLSDT